MVPNAADYCNAQNRWRTEKMNNKTLAKAIESEIHSYAKENLAIINIFIKEPSLKRFRKTEKMSRISYIASSGGLLGRVCERLSGEQYKIVFLLFADTLPYSHNSIKKSSTAKMA